MRSPDFVIELRSTDNLKNCKTRCRVPEEQFAPGLVVDPKNKQVEIYRQRQAMEVLQSPTTLSGRRNTRVCTGLEPDFGALAKSSEGGSFSVGNFSRQRCESCHFFHAELKYGADHPG